jgi:hypothetical protein
VLKAWSLAWFLALCDWDMVDTLKKDLMVGCLVIRDTLFKGVVGPLFLPLFHVLPWSDNFALPYASIVIYCYRPKATGKTGHELKTPKLCAKITFSLYKLVYLRYLLQLWKAD